MRRLVPILLPAVLALLIAPAGQTVVGGSAIQVQSVPWTVYLKRTGTFSESACSGSIVDASHVLTAAHCVYRTNGTVATPNSLTIRAGISNFNTPLGSDVEQDRSVSSVRVHPGYSPTDDVGADDVAVLAVSTPFDLSGPAVQAATLASAGSAFPAGDTATLAGFGQETGGTQPDGSLNTLTATIEPRGDCGGQQALLGDPSAVMMCAANATASVCHGDSGGALVRADSHTIVGIAVQVASDSCAPGTEGIYTYTEAPEILAFIQGNDNPPAAPRTTAATTLTMSGPATVRVGSVLSCKSSGWAGDPTITFAFIDNATGAVIQQGSSYAVTAAAVGKQIACQALATNTGGTTVEETTPTDAVLPAPNLTVRLYSAATGTRGGTAKVRVALVTSSGVTGKFFACVTPPASIAARACASEHLAKLYTRVVLTVVLHVRASAPPGTHRLALSGSAGASQSQSTAQIHIAG